jgi:hypothetical protein
MHGETYHWLFLEAHAAEMAALGVMRTQVDALKRDLERYRQ